MRGEHQTFEVTIPFPDGVTRDLESYSVPHVLEDGSIPGVFLMERDVSEQKRDKDALQASEIVPHPVPWTQVCLMRRA